MTPETHVYYIAYWQWFNKFKSTFAHQTSHELNFIEAISWDIHTVIFNMRNHAARRDFVQRFGERALYHPEHRIICIPSHEGLDSTVTLLVAATEQQDSPWHS